MIEMKTPPRANQHPEAVLRDIAFAPGSAGLAGLVELMVPDDAIVRHGSQAQGRQGPWRSNRHARAQDAGQARS